MGNVTDNVPNTWNAEEEDSDIRYFVIRFCVALFLFIITHNKLPFALPNVFGTFIRLQTFDKAVIASD